MPRLRRRAHTARSGELSFGSVDWLLVRMCPRLYWRPWVLAEFRRTMRQHGRSEALERWELERAIGLIRWKDRTE